MPEIFGVTGWKNSGKTTLVTRLIEEFRRRDLVVSTIKHASDDFEIDQPGTDSDRHRASGAQEVAIISNAKWALIHQTPNATSAPSLETMLGKMAPCDLVLVEGFKSSAIPKIECIRIGTSDSEPIWMSNKSVVALATDEETDTGERPQFHLDEIDRIADYISQLTGLHNP